MIDTPSLSSDHALLLAALCAGRASWEPFPVGELSGYGNVRVGGVPFTRLDGYRCPLLYDGVREALRAALED